MLTKNLKLTDQDGKTVELSFYNTSAEGNNCLLNALFGNLSEGSAITIEDKERTKKMRGEIREFLRSGYDKLSEENKSIKDSIISESYKYLCCCLEGDQKVEDLVNDGEQLVCNLIPIIMFLSGIEKVTLYTVDNGSAELNGTEKTTKVEYTLHSSVFNQVNKKEEVWGNSNAKEYTLFLHFGHYSRAKVINQEKLVSVGDASIGSATRSNQKDNKDTPLLLKKTSDDLNSNTQPKPTVRSLVANKDSKRVSNAQGNSKQSSYLDQNNPASQSTRSKLPVIAASMLAITGVAAGIAIASLLGNLAVGITVGACCLLAAAIIYYCNRPSHSLENSSAENVESAEKVVNPICLS